MEDLSGTQPLLLIYRPFSLDFCVWSLLLETTFGRSCSHSPKTRKFKPKFPYINCVLILQLNASACRLEGPGRFLAKFWPSSSSSWRPIYIGLHDDDDDGQNLAKNLPGPSSRHAEAFSCKINTQFMYGNFGLNFLVFGLCEQDLPKVVSKRRLQTQKSKENGL